MTSSPARPRLLFALQHNGKWFFLSAPQRLNPDHNSSSSLVVDHHKPFPSYYSFDMCAPVHGLICTNSMKPMICNPSTGKYIALPKVTSSRTFFGYDPINNIFKVLSLHYWGYRVLTLGSGELSWRTIECSIPHFCHEANVGSGGDGICINGVLYYLAYEIERYYQGRDMLVCFDVRYEKFKCRAMAMGNEICPSTLINYKGRLGAVRYDVLIGGHTGFVLRVLDDVDENKWSKHVYVLPSLPPSWRDQAAETRLHVVGMTCTGDFVLSPKYTLSDPFSVFYYNAERNTLVRVEVELGIVASKLQYVYTFCRSYREYEAYAKMLTTA